MQQPSVLTIDDACLRGWPLPLPGGDGDKESRGKVLIVAGSREMPGAAMLAATGALRAGAGKVVVATAASVAMAIAVAVPELRVVGLRETAGGGIDPACIEQIVALARHAGVLLIGPGMQDEDASHAVARGLRRWLPSVPTILDAAALQAVLQPQATGGAAPPLVTPHAGEMAHLCRCSKAAVLADPLAAALEAARRWNAIVLMKGACTFIAHPDGRVWSHAEGDVGLATAGSGDTLAGVIAGLAARSAPLQQAAAWGVALHARAGRRLAERCGSLGFLARELADQVPALIDAAAPAPPTR